jgi:hypothetical protein
LPEGQRRLARYLLKHTGSGAPVIIRYGSRGVASGPPEGL